MTTRPAAQDDRAGAGRQEPQSPAVEIAERPALAPGVQLIGEMPDTGFVHRQWLIQRDGRFLQVTELLYRIAEQIDGKRTLAEIAERVTEATEWIVEAEDVKRLLEARLIPLGLVASTGPTPRSEPAAPSAPRSPLALTLRVKTLSPRWIDPITRVLQVFFAPALLVPILVASLLAHWWLYREHDITASVQAVLTTPGGLLLTLAILIVAGFFHEFGHAAALRYGGGRVRGMGMGLYLVYPALYTDVTDSYRLGRWARVRTDLGGVYFHLIAALVLVGLSVASGNELLLFAVVLIDLLILAQFIPFMRFDGYWALADLTGIPDFFSQMGPFVRSLVPGARSEGSRLPPLKRWVKITFAVYMLATVPVLTYLFFFLVYRLPRFLARSWDAFLLQMELFSLARVEGDLLSLLLVLTQVGLLALPVLGTFLIIYTVSRAPVRAIWRWSRPTSGRRLAAALGATGMAGFIGLLWVPQFRDLAGTESDLAQVRRVMQETGRVAAVLHPAREATRKLETLQADLEGSIGSSYFSGTALLQRPNLARVKIEGDDDVGEFHVVSDGKEVFVYFPADNRYTRSWAEGQGRSIRTFLARPVELFFRPDEIGMATDGEQSRYVGREALEGAAYDVIEVTGASGGTKRTRYFISPKDNLVHQIVTLTTRADGNTAMTRIRLKNLRPDAPIDGAAFAWRPPATARPLQMPAGIALPLGSAGR